MAAAINRSPWISRLAQWPNLNFMSDSLLEIE